MSIALEAGEADAFGEGSTDDSLHRSFLIASSRMLKEAAKELGDEENGTFTDTFWDRLRQNPASRSRHSVPDVVSSWKPLPGNGAAPNLSVAKGVFELKRTAREGEMEEEVLEDEDEDAQVQKDEDAQDAEGQAKSVHPGHDSPPRVDGGPARAGLMSGVSNARAGDPEAIGRRMR